MICGMQSDSARARATRETRNRILDVALEVLGQNPDAGMADVAAAAGVVRRTVYGHFPSRDELVHALAQRAVDEITAVLAEAGGVGASGGADTAADAKADTAAATATPDDAGTDATTPPPDRVWADFVARLWPLTRRYRVLLALRRGEYGNEIHALLTPVDEALADLVARGQASGAFGRHLAPGILSQVAYAAVFSIAENALAESALAERAPAVSALAANALAADARPANTPANSPAADTPDPRAATVTSLLLLGVPEERANALADAAP